MSAAWISFAFLPLLLHLIQVVRWAAGFRGVMPQHDAGASMDEGHKRWTARDLTVVLPVRNEASALPRLLQDLAAGQCTPAEVIVIDDASEDQTVDRVHSMSAELPFAVRCIDNPGSGKKPGLSAGIRAAKTTWIVQVDADVRVGPRFMGAVDRHLASEGSASDMLLLPLRLADRASGAPQTLFARLQALDFAAMQGWAVSAVRRGRPAMASGGAWVWRASAFPHDGLRPDIASGDDVFSLATLIERGDGHRVGWCGETDAMASAAPMPDFGSLLDQRIRWGAKSTAYPKALAEARRVAATIAAVHVAGVALLAIDPRSGLLFWSAKALIDMAYTHGIGRAYGLFDGMGALKRWTNLLALALTHPPFIITTLLLMPFRRVRWKGRATA